MKRNCLEVSKPKVRVLVVEDEVIIAKDMKHILATMGCDVAATASSGEESIRKAEMIQPDLVFMDIRLKGGMDGVEAAHRITDDLKIPVVYVTAFGEEIVPDEAEPAGELLRVTKPFEESEIERIVKRFLTAYNN